MHAGILICQVVAVAKAVRQAIACGHRRPAVHRRNSRVGAAVVSATAKVDATTLTVQSRVGAEVNAATIAGYPGNLVGVAPQDDVSGVGLNRHRCCCFNIADSLSYESVCASGDRLVRANSYSAGIKLNRASYVPRAAESPSGVVCGLVST